MCHIWELGGDALLFPQLIETPILTNRRLDKFAIFLVLDLSVPETLWVTLESAVVNAKKYVSVSMGTQSILLEHSGYGRMMIGCDFLGFLFAEQ